MHVCSANDDFEQKECVLLALLQLRSVIDNCSHNELLRSGARKAALTIFGNKVGRLLVGRHVPTLNGSLVMGVIKINARLVELLHLKAISERAIDHPQRKLE